MSSKIQALEAKARSYESYQIEVKTLAGRLSELVAVGVGGTSSVDLYNIQYLTFLIRVYFFY